MDARGQIRVMLVDDHRMMREGLRALFERHCDVAIVGEAEDAPEGVRVGRPLKPHVVLMDVLMDGAGGLEAARTLREGLPSTKIIALSMLCTRTFVAEMLRAGVRGYLLKQNAFSELLAAVRAVMTGETYLCSAARTAVVEDYVHSRADSGPSAGPVLSDRQRTILRMIADGKSSKEIAAHLHLSSKTVDAARRQIMRKLGVQSLAALVKAAIRMGITSV